MVSPGGAKEYCPETRRAGARPTPDAKDEPLPPHPGLDYETHKLLSRLLQLPNSRFRIALFLLISSPRPPRLRVKPAFSSSILPLLILFPFLIPLTSVFHRCNLWIPFGLPPDAARI